MKQERSDVEFPIWRKKVDKSLFEHNGTTIPEWACKMWELNGIYGSVTSKNDPASACQISFQRINYDAWVTTAPHGRSSPAYRLWFKDKLGVRLKHVYVMSYMRSLEGRLGDDGDIEAQIPFWEFLDIEFDRDQRAFRFKAYYTVKPIFSQLFARLVGSPAIKGVDDELSNKGHDRIHKQDWRPRSEVEFEVGARNVIYMLLDRESKHFYIGQAADLVVRLVQPHSSIPKWNYYRYDVLPPALSSFRVALERMIIRNFAAVLENKGGVHWFDISGCALMNDRIDR
jgi:hypothetical protein